LPDLPACKSILDGNVLPLDVTVLPQSLPESLDFRRGSGRAVEQEANPVDFPCLLRPRCERPGGRRAAEQRDKFATFQSIELH
jgi:hypothetical protein